MTPDLNLFFIQHSALVYTVFKCIVLFECYAAENIVLSNLSCLALQMFNWLSNRSSDQEYKEVMSAIRKLVSEHKSSLVAGEPQLNMCDPAVMVSDHNPLQVICRNKSVQEPVLLDGLNGGVTLRVDGSILPILTVGGSILGLLTADRYQEKILL